MKPPRSFVGNPTKSSNAAVIFHLTYVQSPKAAVPSKGKSGNLVKAPPFVATNSAHLAKTPSSSTKDHTNLVKAPSSVMRDHAHPANAPSSSTRDHTHLGKAAPSSASNPARLAKPISSATGAVREEEASRSFPSNSSRHLVKDILHPFGRSGHDIVRNCLNAS